MRHQRLGIGVVSIIASWLMGSCAGVPTVDPFAADGPVWPAQPQQARIQYVGEFSSPADLGMQRGFWSRLVALAVGEPDYRLVRPMAVAASGNLIYVADPGAGCVHRFNQQTMRYQQMRRQDDMPLLSPVGLAVTQSGRIFVADSRLGKIFTAAADDKELQPFAPDTDVLQPTGLAWNEDDQLLYVVDTRAQTVKKLSLAGDVVGTIGGRGTAAGMLNFPTYAWSDAGRELLVSDSLNFRVQRFDNSGQPLGAFGQPGTVSGTLSRPKGIATDSDGHVYVVDALLHSMQVFDKSGGLLLAVGEQGQSAGQFWLPAGLYIDKADRIYVADAFNSRVQVFRYLGAEQ